LYYWGRMEIQTISNEDESTVEPFVVIYKDGTMLAINAHTYMFQASGDLVEFYKAPGVKNDHAFFRSSQIRTIVAESDLAKVPAFIEMQTQFTKINQRLERIEEALF
jgi:hypothetical protein